MAEKRGADGLGTEGTYISVVFVETKRRFKIKLDYSGTDNELFP